MANLYILSIFWKGQYNQEFFVTIKTKSNIVLHVYTLCQIMQRNSSSVATLKLIGRHQRLNKGIWVDMKGIKYPVLLNSEGSMTDATTVPNFI